VAWDTPVRWAMSIDVAFAFICSATRKLLRRRHAVRVKS